MAAIDRIEFEGGQHTARNILKALIANKSNFFEPDIFILDKVAAFESFLHWINDEWELEEELSKSTFLDNVLESQREAERIAQQNDWTF